jgi:hypothetical protein
MPTYPPKRPPSDEQDTGTEPTRGPAWIDVRAVARLRASSEDPQHAIARAFSTTHGPGWRAADPGVQVIEVHFREPRDLTHIRLVFEHEGPARTQEFTIAWSARRGETHREIVRQQFNFSPGGATREVEDYTMALQGVETLTIRITPDISGGGARASLAECRLA